MSETLAALVDELNDQKRLIGLSIIFTLLAGLPALIMSIPCYFASMIFVKIFPNLAYLPLRVRLIKHLWNLIHDSYGNQNSYIKFLIVLSVIAIVPLGVFLQQPLSIWLAFYSLLLKNKNPSEANLFLLIAFVINIFSLFIFNPFDPDPGSFKDAVRLIVFCLNVPIFVKLMVFWIAPLNKAFDFYYLKFLYVVNLATHHLGGFPVAITAVFLSIIYLVLPGNFEKKSANLRNTYLSMFMLLSCCSVSFYTLGGMLTLAGMNQK